MPVEKSQETEGHWVGQEKERYDFVLKYLSGNTTSRGYCVHNFIDKKNPFYDSTVFGDSESSNSMIICFSSKVT